MKNLSLFKSLSNTNLVASTGVLLVAIISLPAFRLIPANANPELTFWGVDYSYAWMINFLAGTDFSAIQHTFFPHGALGFIQYAWPLSGHLEVAWVVIILQRIILAASLYVLASEISPKLVRLLLIALALSLLNFPQGVSLMAVVSALLILKNKNALFPFVVLSISLLCSFYTRLFPFLLSLGGVFSILLWLMMNRDYKNIIKLLGFVFSSVVIVIALWLTLFHDISSLFERLFMWFEMMEGGSYATSVYPNNNTYLLIGSFISLFVFIALWYKKTEYVVLVALFFLIFKYSFVTENYPHTVQLVKLFHIPLFLSIGIDRRFLRPIGLILASAVFYLLNLGLISGRYWPEPLTSFTKHPLLTVFSESKSAQEFAKLTKPIADLHQWPEASQLVSGSTTSVFPYDYIYPIVNGSKFVPTPVSQSYVAYTDILDSLQSEFFIKNDSIEYIYFHNGFGYDKNLSINRQFHSFVAPRTQKTIKEYYEVVLKRDDVLLLKRRKEPAKMTGDRLISAHQFNQVFSFGENMKGFDLKVELNSIGKVRSLLYKPPRVQVKVYFSNGKEMLFDINILHKRFYIDVYEFHDLDLVAIEIIISDKQRIYFK